MAGRGNPLVDKDDLRDDVFDPNLRDEGAGFFSTLFTAGSNIGTDALTELGYLAQAVASPIDTGEAILRVAAGYAQKALPDSFEQYLPEDWATNKMYANAINDYYAEKYGSLEQAADSFAEQPVSVALDVFAVKALLTAVTKQAVKRSNATTKMAKTAEGTVLEGELAARAAADLKVAAELEKTVKYEGKLKYDESLGAYVPEAELAARTSLDAAEVAPIVSAIDEAVPTMNNSPIQQSGPVGTAEGMLKNVDELDEFTIVRDDLGVVSPDEMAALSQATRDARDAARKINEDWMDTVDNPALNSEIVYGETVIPAKIKTHEAEIAHMEASMANSGRSGADSNYTKAIADEKAKIAALELDAAEIIATERAIPDVEVPVAATSGINLQGTRAGDGSLMAATRNQTVAPALAESAVKMADDAKVVASKADDAKMAAATQAELFSTGTAAQYELMQASKIANDLAKVTPDVPAVVGTRMMAPTESTKLAKYADVERRTTPPSIPQTKLNVDIKKVVPAVQRVAAAAGQGERGQDGSLIPMTPDKGIDLSEPFVPIVPERIDVEQPENTRPGWKLPHQFEGSTNEGNYWSADFEDEHWNTPAGISEAMGIWGRPIGNRKIVNPR